MRFYSILSSHASLGGWAGCSVAFEAIIVKLYPKAIFHESMSLG